MEQLIQIVDLAIIIFLGCLFATLIFQVFPKLFRLFTRIEDVDNESRLGYFSNGDYWNWLLSKQGMVNIVKDKKENRLLYVNSFRFFNIFWKLLIVLLTFRVLLIFFGQNIIE